MNYNLDHLPASRRKHLAHIVAVLRDEVEQVTAFSTGKRKHGRILKIILFGSHATGKWVNDPAHGYVSDYDILVILNNKALAEDFKIWDTAEDRIALRVRPPLNLLVHTLQEVNDALAQGHYFFTDIRREGIMLYESDKRELALPGYVTPEDHKALAQQHYAQWFESAVSFLVTFKSVFDRGDYKQAAFQLHQAAERFYACLLLVLTNYKPNTHNLARLNALAILQDERIAQVFPQDQKRHRRCFQLLKGAYVDARYSEHYAITSEELAWLAERVTLLRRITQQRCKDTIGDPGTMAAER